MLRNVCVIVYEFLCDIDFALSLQTIYTSRSYLRVLTMLFICLCVSQRMRKFAIPYLLMVVLSTN
jgi:hypothetical protein